MIGEQIKDIRKARGFTQQQFADKIGISAKHLNELERGKKFPRWQMLELILSELHVEFRLIAKAGNFK